MSVISIARSRSFPSGSIIIRPKAYAGVEIGIYEKEGRFGFKSYQGRSNKPNNFYIYRTEELRNAAVEKFLLSLAAQAERKIQEKENRKLKSNPVEVGTIFYSSWGYDQTNVDFYQVIAMKGLSVTIRRIASEMVEGGQTSGMSSNVIAKPDAFLSDYEPMTKRLITRDGGQSVTIKLNSYNWAWIWDGKPKYSSWYA